MYIYPCIHKALYLHLRNIQLCGQLRSHMDSTLLIRSALRPANGPVSSPYLFGYRIEVQIQIQIQNRIHIRICSYVSTSSTAMYLSLSLKIPFTRYFSACDGHPCVYSRRLLFIFYTYVLMFAYCTIWAHSPPWYLFYIYLISHF